jgi:hypothetical protein
VGTGSAGFSEQKEASSSEKHGSPGIKTDNPSTALLGTFLQRGRCAGASGAINYLRWTLNGYNAASCPVDYSVLPAAFTSAQSTHILHLYCTCTVLVLHLYCTCTVLVLLHCISYVCCCAIYYSEVGTS